MAKQKKAGKTIDFSGVEAGTTLVPEGSHPATVEEVSLEESSEGNEYLKWTYKVKPEGGGGGRVWDNTSLQPQSLWRLKGLLEVLGIDGLDGELEVDDIIAEVAGAELTVEISHETYQGKPKARVTGFAAPMSSGKPSKKAEKEEPEDDEEDEKDDDEEDEKPKSKSKSSAAKFKRGDAVSFKDDDGTKHKGKITALDGDQATVNSKGEDWELDVSELTAA